MRYMRWGSSITPFCTHFYAAAALPPPSAQIDT
jgi:hypothetical protein